MLPSVRQPAAAPSTTPAKADAMRAMVFEGPGRPLALTEMPLPTPDDDQLLIRVSACAVCRTDLHIVDGELASSEAAAGARAPDRRRRRGDGRRVDRFAVGDRVGVPWLGWTCGVCRYCRSGRENLCDRRRFTGYRHRRWVCRAHRRRCSASVSRFPTATATSQAAPLLCAGLIGYRALRMAGDARADRPLRLRRGRSHHRAGRGARRPRGLRLHPARRRRRRRSSPAAWARLGRRLRRRAARAARRGDHLRPGRARWCRPRCGGRARGHRRLRRDPHERHPVVSLRAALGGARVRSVANFDPEGRRGVSALAPRVPVRTQTSVYPLASANEALQDLRSGSLEGAAVLLP